MTRAERAGAPARRSGSSAWLAGGLAAVALTAVLTHVGLWAAPLLVGLAWGLGAPGRGWRLLGGLMIGLLGYLVLLAIAALSLPMARTADLVAAIMGFGLAGGIVWLLTLLFAALMGLAGGWLGHAVKSLLAASRAGAASAAGTSAEAPRS